MKKSLYLLSILMINLYYTNLKNKYDSKEIKIEKSMNDKVKKKIAPKIELATTVEKPQILEEKKEEVKEEKILTSVEENTSNNQIIIIPEQITRVEDKEEVKKPVEEEYKSNEVKDTDAKEELASIEPAVVPEIENEKIQKEEIQNEKIEEIDLNDKVELENIDYVIKKGDTIYDLSKEFEINTDYIFANNSKENLNVLQIGKRIKIPNENGIFYEIKKGDTLESIAKKFSVKVDILKDDNEVDTLLIGANIFVREPKISRYTKKTAIKNIKPVKSNKSVASISGFVNPLSDMVLTSAFGTRNHPVLKRVIKHGGIDLRAKTGTKVYSANDGVVTYAGSASGYGKLVIIKHPNGFETRYAHLSRITVKKGQKVSKRQQIALSGATGRVTGPHLHFEIIKNGEKKNPLQYIKI